MRKIAIFILFCLLSFTSMKAGNTDGYGPVKDEQAFRKELMTRTSAVTSIQTKFIQEKFLSVFSRIVKSEGRFTGRNRTVSALTIRHLQNIVSRLPVTG